MIEITDVEPSEIRAHYDWTTPFYRLLWGPHIHHGLWDSSENPATAQVNLINTAARLAGVAKGQSLLDVGCGIGGSSIHLARHLGCRVTGVTLSPLQRLWAAVSSICQGVGQQTRFYCADAEDTEFPQESFDVIWSIECTEHFYDKAAFFQRAARWLKPGGRVVICAWLVGEHATSPTAFQHVRDVCAGFLCPSLGSFADYEQWMVDAGLTLEHRDDWTQRVLATWEICVRRVQRIGACWLAQKVDRNTARFLEHFETILEAYRCGAMQYGCVVAAKANPSLSIAMDCG